MLIEFSITNFRSIKQATFSMLPSGRIRKNEHRESLAYIQKYDINLLKYSLIYGANASGKSNFLMALEALRYLVTSSANFQLDSKLGPYEPFKLDTETKESPVSFEIDFLSKESIRYKYKIEFTATEFTHESLFSYPMGQKAKIFLRDQEGKITYGDYFKGSKRHQLLPNQLLLSLAGITPIESLTEPYRFFSRYLFCHVFHDTQYDEALITSFAQFVAKEGTKLRDEVNRLICAADAGITALNIREVDENEFTFPKDFSDEKRKEIVEQYKYQIRTEHPLYTKNEKVGVEFFDLEEESTGTIKLLAISSLIINALENGSVIIIDELDKSLHPLLTKMLISLFGSKINNPHNAQLIFATHDTSLIDQTLLRRDQIWLTEKKSGGMTELYPLSDFTGISKVRPLDNWYMYGRFGAIPNIKKFMLNEELVDAED